MTHDTWHHLPTTTAPADWQLAAGDALLAALDTPDTTPPPVLRWYRMSPAALILGSGQKVQAFDRDACRAAGVSLYRRSSGGTAVLAEPDQIMLDIALPAAHPLYRHDITESYRWLGEAWVAALAELRLTPRLLPTAEARTDRQALDALTARSCYGGRSPYEVLVDGRKVVGLAQKRRRYGALLQAALYIHWEPERLVRLFAMPADERPPLAANLRARVAGLADVLPADQQRPADELFSQVASTFAETLRALHGVTLADTPWRDEARAALARLLPRYAPLSLDA
jgi:lipoate-protein ligase A